MDFQEMTVIDEHSVTVSWLSEPHKIQNNTYLDP